jgi:hypothetical protein
LVHAEVTAAAWHDRHEQISWICVGYDERGSRGSLGIPMGRSR